MNLLLLFLIPSFLALTTLPWIANRRLAAYWSACLSWMSFLMAIPLIIQSYGSKTPVFFMDHWLFCDKLSAFFIGIHAFITMTTSFYAISYLSNEPKFMLHRLTYRFYHTFFHIFSVGVVLVILSNNIGLMWVAIELATIASIILVALYQTPEALEAAWKYLILCGVGIGLALLGTIIIYFAAYTYAPNSNSLLWTSLFMEAPHLSSKLLAIAFVFLFIGYGTKVGFFPLHNWLPDAYTEGPSLSGLLSGLLLNAAFLAIFRFKLILSITSVAPFASDLLLLFGSLSFLFAAFSLLRQRQLKRLLAYSSIEHMGLISIAFGLGTPLAYVAGLLHLLMHSLGKSAAFFCVGSIIQTFKTQTISQLKGLNADRPVVAWCFVLTCLTLLGLPPSGFFFSELLLIVAMLHSHFSWMIIPLLIGLGMAFFGFLAKIQSMLSSTNPLHAKSLVHRAHLTWPPILHLLLIIMSGLYVPLVFIYPVIQAII